MLAAHQPNVGSACVLPIIRRALDDNWSIGTAVVDVDSPAVTLHPAKLCASWTNSGVPAPIQRCRERERVGDIIRQGLGSLLAAGLAATATAYKASELASPCQSAKH